MAFPTSTSGIWHLVVTSNQLRHYSTSISHYSSESFINAFNTYFEFCIPPPSLNTQMEREVV